jgi:anti-anti-sigma factor
VEFRGVVEVVAGVPTVVCEGIVDLATAPTFRDLLQRLVAQHPGVVVAVDLDGVVTLDDVALGVLIGAASSARQNGGELHVVASTHRVVERLATTHVDRVMTVVSSLSGAS